MEARGAARLRPIWRLAVLVHLAGYSHQEIARATSHTYDSLRHPRALGQLPHLLEEPTAMLRERLRHEGEASSAAQGGGTTFEHPRI